MVVIMDKVKKFRKVCEDCSARLWSHEIFDEDNNLVRVDVEDYSNAKKIMGVAEELGFRREEYFEHTHNIALAFDVGSLKEKFFPRVEWKLF